ncbi:hypothetical protein ACSSS7_000913 [Eimeria intestinalis]
MLRSGERERARMLLVYGARAGFLLAAVLLASTSISFTRADVGYSSYNGYRIDQDDVLGSGLWAMTPEGCRVGAPGNLVVTPLGGTNSEGGELLDTLHIGPQLCSWLSMLEKAHYSPRPGYNRPLAVGASGWQYVAGFLAGMGAGSDREKSSIAVTWDWAATMYGHMASFITLKGHIDEYWMNDGRLLHVQWRVFTQTVCEKLHHEASLGVMSAIKAARVNSVRLNITGLDLFKDRRPVLWGVLDEGVLNVNVSAALLRMEIDTSPSNVSDYERSKATAQNVRAAGLVFKGIKWLFSGSEEK